MGITAYSMDMAGDFIEELCELYLPQLNNGPDLINSYMVAWFFFASVCVCCGTMAGLLTTYWGTGASGSGVAELIGYINGINYPKFIGLDTLVTKIVGVTLAVGSNLAIGKEGPLAHIGANIGCYVCYLHPCFKFLRNDESKR